MHQADIKVIGVDCLVTRCGYTGEDGFEISVPNKNARHLFETLLTNKNSRPAGLAVRDSLRLESGLCLYGHELNENISPVEASLNWIISKKRQDGGFLGADAIKRQLSQGVTRKRVGLIVTKGAPIREGYEVLKDGQNIGVISSGSFSPSLKKPIGMAYLNTSYTKLGSQVHVMVRGSPSEAEVVALPFVPNKYYRAPK